MRLQGAGGFIGQERTVDGRGQQSSWRVDGSLKTAKTSGSRVQEQSVNRRPWEELRGEPRDEQAVKLGWSSGRGRD